MQKLFNRTGLSGSDCESSLLSVRSTLLHPKQRAVESGSCRSSDSSCEAARASPARCARRSATAARWSAQSQLESRQDGTLSNLTAKIADCLLIFTQAPKQANMS